MTSGKTEDLFGRFGERSVDSGNRNLAGVFMGDDFIGLRSAERGPRARTARTLRSINRRASRPVSGGMERAGYLAAVPVVPRVVPVESVA